MPAPSNIETLKLNNSGATIGHFSCPSLYYPPIVPGLYLVVTGKPSSQLEKSLLRPLSDTTSYCRSFSTLLNSVDIVKQKKNSRRLRRKRKTWRMLRWKYTIHVTAGLTNRRLLCKHKSCGKCTAIWKEPVLCVNGFSTGAMSRDNVHATEFPRALTHDFPVPHSQVIFK